MRLSLIILLLSCLLPVTVQADEKFTPKLKGPKGVDYGLQGTKYGPITNRDTMWKLGNKFRFNSQVSVYQVMVAIVKKNPDAFEYDNLNGLRNGSMLFIPTNKEILEVEPTYAKQRADADDEIWQARLNGTYTELEEQMLLQPIEDAKQQDVADATKELTEKIEEVSMEQNSKLSGMQTQLDTSMKNVEMVLSDNKTVQDRLSSLGSEIEQIKAQLGAESQLQQQMIEIIDNLQKLQTQQQEDLAIARAMAEEKSIWDHIVDFASSTLGMILLSVIPALLVLASIVLFLRKKSKAANNDIPEPSPLPDFNPSATAAGADTTATAALADDALSDPMDDLNDALGGFDLDDALDDAIQLDDGDDLDLADALGDDLLGDELNLEPELATEDELDEPAVEVDVDSSDDILDANDIDALLEADNAEDLIPEPTSEAEDDFDADNILTAGDIEELMEQDDEDDVNDLDQDEFDTEEDDVDAIMDELGVDLNEENESPEADLDVDDILDTQALDEEVVDEETTDEMAVEQEKSAEQAPVEDELDIDDILDAQGAEEEVAEKAALEQESLDEEVVEQEKPAEQAPVEDELDIDDILDAQGAEEGAVEEVAEEAALEQESLDEEVVEQEKPAEQAPVEDELDIDDILDAQGAEEEVAEKAALEQESHDEEVVEQEKPAEQAPVEDELDIDDILDAQEAEEGAVEEEVAEEAALEQESLDEEVVEQEKPAEQAPVEDELDIDDILDAQGAEEGAVEEEVAEEVALEQESFDEEVVEQEKPVEDDDRLIESSVDELVAEDEQEALLQESENIDDLLDEENQVDIDDLGDDLSIISEEADESDDVANLAEEETEQDHPDADIQASAELDVYPELNLNDAEQVDIDELGDDLDAGLTEDDISSLVSDSDLSAEQVLAEDENLGFEESSISELLADPDEGQPEEQQEIQQLEEADFDQLLSELSEDPHESAEKALSEVEQAIENADIDLAIDDPLEEDELVDMNLSDGLLSEKDNDFLNVESIMDDLDDDTDVEIPEELNIDVGLADLEELATERGTVDVDKTSGGFANQLDLARTYIEMGDDENARLELSKVLKSDSDEAKQQAQELLAALTTE